jgi:hypothetical protein
MLMIILKSVSDKSSPILFADDTSFIIANCDKTEFKFNTNEKFFRSHYGPGVDSASNRNEYQEHFLGVKAAGA